MSRPTMTRDLAYAAATDHANRRMRAMDRSVWNEGDYAAAVARFNLLCPGAGEEIGPHMHTFPICKWCGAEAPKGVHR